MYGQLSSKWVERPKVWPGVNPRFWDYPLNEGGGGGGSDILRGI